MWVERGSIMAGITLHSENNETVTCVPNVFIDELMADADGEYVKIYLYLLRCMNAPEESFSISGMADKFEHTEKDIKRALAYWEKAKVLHLEYDSSRRLTGICLSNPSRLSDTHEPDTTTGAASDTAAPASCSTGEDAFRTHSGSAPVPGTQQDAPKADYSADEMRAFQQDKGVQELLFMTETYLGHTLNATDINAILYWHDSLGFSMELIEYLIEYCVGGGHKSMRYMETVALSWHKEGILSVSQAKEKNERYSKTNTAVMKAFGISGRNLVESELAFIEKWTGSYGFSIELVTEACRRTMQAIHQPSFEYTDSILNNWHKKQVSSLKEIAALDEAFSNRKPKQQGRAARSSSPAPNRFNNFSQRSYDFDQLERQVLKS